MAEALKRAFDLIVLKVEYLSPEKDRNNVRYTLQCREDGQLKDVFQGYCKTAEMGLGALKERFFAKHWNPTLTLPTGMVRQLEDWFESETDGDRPLWVHLVAPYYTLRFIPWERLLGGALSVPILMLPDFIFPPPREALDVLDVVVCGSAPLGSEAGWIYQTLDQAVEHIIESEVRKLRLHVFIDEQSKDQLAARWKSRGWLDDKIVLYPHEGAEKYVEDDIPSRLVDSCGVIRSPWLLWMREALKNTTVDVVHFVCHGHLSRESGALLFAQSPLERSERYLAGPVGFNELQTFLTQVGAWSAVFSSTPDNFSEIGMRALADEVAQNRPGPLLMHTSSLDPQGHALREAYRFLYSTGGPQAPPCSESLFIYCQPYLATAPADESVHIQTRPTRRPFRSRSALIPLERARNPIQSKTIEQIETSVSPLENMFLSGSNVTNLAATTERFAEQVELRFQKIARDEIFSDEMLMQRSKTATEMLERLRNVVADRTNIGVEKVEPEASQGESQQMEGLM